MANITANAQVAKGIAYGGMSARSISECLAAIGPGAAPASPFSFAPATASITWTDKNGRHTGNLSYFSSKADLPSVTSIQGNDVGLTSITNLSVLPNLAVLTVANNSLTTLDISGNPQLTSVLVDGNELSSTAVSVILENLALAGKFAGDANLSSQSPSAPVNTGGNVAYYKLLQSGWQLSVDGPIGPLAPTLTGINFLSLIQTTNGIGDAGGRVTLYNAPSSAGPWTLVFSGTYSNPCTWTVLAGSYGGGFWYVTETGNGSEYDAVESPPSDIVQWQLHPD